MRRLLVLLAVAVASLTFGTSDAHAKPAHPAKSHARSKAAARPKAPRVVKAKPATVTPVAHRASKKH